MALKHLTDEERFFQYIDIDMKTECWNWKGFLTKTGYGMFSVGSRTDKTRKTFKTHRWAYKNFVGGLDQDLTIDHICNNRSCSNPEHLRQISIKENVRSGKFSNARKTHCSNGHEFNTENTWMYKNKRHCKTCRKSRLNMDQKNLRARKKLVQCVVA